MNPAVFQFDGAVVRTFADSQGEPWFNASDVCKVLGYKNPRMSVERHCRPPGITKRDMGVVTGQKANGSDAVQQVEHSFINEGNLYRLIIKSRKPEAERFEAWVCDEVLPAIRKTGAYTHPQAQEAVVGQISISGAEYIQLLKKCAEQAEKCTELAELKHKTQYTNHCLTMAKQLIDHGRHTREQIAVVSGLALETVDYLYATYGTTRSRTVGGAPFVVCKG